MQDGTFRNPTLFSQNGAGTSSKRFFIDRAILSHAKTGLGFREKNLRALKHIEALLQVERPDKKELMRNFDERSSQLVALGIVGEDAQYVQLLFEVRSKLLFRECQRLLDEMISGAINYSEDIYSSAEKNNVFSIVKQIRQEAEALQSRMGTVRESKASSSHMNYYKKIADLAAHYQTLKILCSLEKFDEAMSPLDYYYMASEQRDYSSPQVKHIEPLKHIFMLHDLEIALKARDIKDNIEPAFTSEILLMPFYTREFL